MTRTFMVFGSFNGNNFGDNAILDTIIQVIDSKYNNYQVLVPTQNPNYINKTYNTPAVKTININVRAGAIRFLSLQTLLHLVKTDKIITTAGILFDYNWHKIIRTSFITSIAPLLVISKLLRKEVLGLNVGIIHKSNIGKFILKYVLKLHDILYLREPQDREILHKLEVNTPYVPSADIVFLNNGLVPRYRRSLKQNSLNIGINLNKYLYKPYHKMNNSNFDSGAIVEEICKWIDDIVIKLNANIILIPTAKMDYGIHEAVKKNVNNNSAVFIHNYTDFSDLIKDMNKVDIMIGTRMHSLIFATCLGLPVCSINYSPKVEGFMGQIGLKDFSFDLEKFSSDSLTNAVMKIINKYEYYVHNQMKSRQVLKEKALKSLKSL